MTKSCCVHFCKEDKKKTQQRSSNEGNEVYSVSSTDEGGHGLVTSFKVYSGFEKVMLL